MCEHCTAVVRPLLQPGRNKLLFVCPRCMTSFLAVTLTFQHYRPLILLIAVFLLTLGSCCAHIGKRIEHCCLEDLEYGGDVQRGASRKCTDTQSEN
eukprot:1142617-Pelagomonas_calceolata.AAC.1